MAKKIREMQSEDITNTLADTTLNKKEIKQKIANRIFAIREYPNSYYRSLSVGATKLQLIKLAKTFPLKKLSVWNRPQENLLNMLETKNGVPFYQQFRRNNATVLAETAKENQKNMVEEKNKIKTESGKENNSYGIYKRKVCRL